MTDRPVTCLGTQSVAAGVDDGSAFRTLYKGGFAGLLKWDDVGHIFDAVRGSPHGWWIYDTRADLPEALEDGERLVVRINEIEQFLRRNHKADYCGFVYVDSKTAPRLIKVFDPRNASSCSLGTPVPAYTISRLMPVALPLGEGASRGKHVGTGEAEHRAGLVRRILKRLS